MFCFVGCYSKFVVYDVFFVEVWVNDYGVIDFGEGYRDWDVVNWERFVFVEYFNFVSFFVVVDFW